MKKRSNLVGIIFGIVLFIGLIGMAASVVYIRGDRTIGDITRFLNYISAYLTNGNWPAMKIWWVSSASVVFLLAAVYAVVKIIKKQIPLASFFFVFGYAGIVTAWHFRLKISHYIDVFNNDDKLATGKAIAFYFFAFSLALVVISLIFNVVVAIINDFMLGKIDDKVEKIRLKKDQDVLEVLDEKAPPAVKEKTKGTKKRKRITSIVLSSIVLLALLGMAGCVIYIRKDRTFDDLTRLLNYISKYLFDSSWYPIKWWWVISSLLVVAVAIVYAIIKISRKQIPFASLFLPFGYAGIIVAWHYRRKIQNYLNALINDKTLAADKQIVFVIFVICLIIVIVYLLSCVLIAIIRDLILQGADRRVEKIKLAVQEERDSIKESEEDPIVRIVRIAKIDIDNAETIAEIDNIVEEAKVKIDEIRGVKSEVVEEITEEVAPTEETVEEKIEEVVVPVEEVVEEPVETEEEVEIIIEDEIKEVEAALNPFFLAIKGKGNLAKSFDFKMRGAPDRTKTWFSGIKNEIMSYKKVRSRISRSGNSFRRGRNLLIKINIVGKTLKVYFALEIENYDVNRFHHKDVHETKKYAEVPFMVKVKSNRSYNNVIFLISELMGKYGCLKNPKFTYIDYVSQYQPDSQNILKSLGLAHLVRSKINVKDANVLTDEQASSLIQRIQIETPEGTKEANSILNIDDISKAFAPNDIVDLAALKDIKLLGRKINGVQILARGEVDKPLIVHANEFSLTAVKMIVLTGGSVIEYCDKNSGKN